MLAAVALVACPGSARRNVLAEDAGAVGPAAAKATRADHAERLANLSPDAASDAAPLRLADRPYDLAGDLRQRTDDVHRRFGARAATRAESDVFLLADADRLAPLDAAAKLVHRALPRYLAGRFTRMPDHAVTVLLFSSHAAFRRECAKIVGDRACAKPLGSYWPRTREVLVDTSQGVESLTHEIVHPIMQTDFPSAPAWIDEGIASLFERPVFDGADGIHGATNWRLAALENALGTDPTKSAARIDALFGMSDDDFRGKNPDRNYAVARFLCQWLDEKGELWGFYRAWRDGVRDEENGGREDDGGREDGSAVKGVKAFTEVVGEGPTEAQAEWWRWAKGLRLPAR